MIVEILLTVAQVVVFLYDVVTYPIYHVMAKINAKKQEKSTTPRATMVKQSSETISWKREKSHENTVYREYIIDNKVCIKLCTYKCTYLLFSSSKSIQKILNFIL